MPKWLPAPKRASRGQSGFLCQSGFQLLNGFWRPKWLFMPKWLPAPERASGGQQDPKSKLTNWQPLCQVPFSGHWRDRANLALVWQDHFWQKPKCKFMSESRKCQKGPGSLLKVSLPTSPGFWCHSKSGVPIWHHSISGVPTWTSPFTLLGEGPSIQGCPGPIWAPKWITPSYISRKTEE